MKNFALAVAALTLGACTHVPRDALIEPIATFEERGVPDAIVCGQRSDAWNYISLAGNNDGQAFTQFVKQALADQRCTFLANTMPVTIEGYQPVVTDNGILFLVQLSQGDYVWFASANYFPTAGELTRHWESQLAVEGE